MSSVRCLDCGSSLNVTRERRKYGDGLNVVIDNVEVRRCPACGEEEIVIEAMDQLNQRIADYLATVERRLTPHEIRFLRTHLGYSSRDLARAMAVSPETVSRWERVEKPTPMGSTAERLLRHLTLCRCTPDDYRLADLNTARESNQQPAAPRLRYTADNRWLVAAKA